MQVPCSSAQEASFLGKPIPVQGHACFTERSIFHPQGPPLSKMEQRSKVLSNCRYISMGCWESTPTAPAPSCASEVTVPPSLLILWNKLP